MNKTNLKTLLTLPIVYYAIVVICALLSFFFAGKLREICALILLILTLPWSVIAAFLTWGMFQGETERYSVIVYLLLGGINALLLNWIRDRIRQMKTG